MPFTAGVAIDEGARWQTAAAAGGGWRCPRRGAILDPRSAREAPSAPGTGVLGMGIFLASLTVLFLASIVGYLVVRLKAPAWPPPGMPRLPNG